MKKITCEKLFFIFNTVAKFLFHSCNRHFRLSLSLPPSLVKFNELFKTKFREKNYESEKNHLVIFSAVIVSRLIFLNEDEHTKLYVSP